jgi:LPS-assembly lipoprotein
MKPSRRRFLTGSLLLPLAGCGFQPVYMPTASGKPGPAARELAAVSVRLIPERAGQVMREALQERFGDDSGTPARYDLTVGLTISGEPIAILPDTDPTRVRVTGRATYVLVTRASPPVQLTTGSARAIDNFNITHDQYFAADLDNQSASRRVIQLMADQIAGQLAMYFRKQAGT